MDDLWLEYDRAKERLFLVQDKVYYELKDFRGWYHMKDNFKCDFWIVPKEGKIYDAYDDSFLECLQTKGKAIKIPYENYCEERVGSVTVYHITLTFPLLNFLCKIKGNFESLENDDLLTQDFEAMIINGV